MISRNNYVWMKVVPGVAGLISLGAVLTVPSWASESKPTARVAEESLVSQLDSTEAMEAEALEVESVEVAPSETESVDVEVPADDTLEVESVEVEPSEAEEIEAFEVEPSEADSTDIEASEIETMEPEAADVEVMDETMESEAPEMDATDEAMEMETSEPESLESEAMPSEEALPQSSDAAPQAESSEEISDNELEQFATTIPQLVTIEQTGQEQIFQVIDQSGLERDRFYEIYQGQDVSDPTAEVTATPEEQSSFETALAQIETIEQEVASQQQNVISASGIEPERFNEIMDIVLSDPQLQLEVQELMVQ